MGSSCESPVGERGSPASSGHAAWIGCTPSGARIDTHLLDARKDGPHADPHRHIAHGGATWNGSVNREQMRDCVNLMGKLVPLVIEVMMDHPGTLWGDAVYPVVTE